MERTNAVSSDIWFLQCITGLLFVHKVVVDTAWWAYAANWGNVAITSSDVRLKEYIESFDGALEKVNALKPRTFTWKDTDFYYNASQRSAKNLTRYGFIADEVIETLPEAGRVPEPTEETPDPIKDYVDRAIISLLVKSVQELSAEVADLKQQLAAKE